MRVNLNPLLIVRQFFYADCDMTDIELADDQQSNCIAEEVKNELRKMNIPLTMQVNQDIQTTPEETSRIGQDFDIKEENMEVLMLFYIVSNYI